MNNKKLQSAQQYAGKYRFDQFFKKLSKLSSIETKRVLVVVVFLLGKGGGELGLWGSLVVFIYLICPYL